MAFYTMEEYIRKNKKKNVPYSAISDIGPVRQPTTNNEMTEDGQKNTYLQKGAFEDGFSLENTVKAANATRTDILEDAAKGTLNFGEKIVDGATMVLTSEASEFVVRMLLGYHTPFREDGIDKFYDNARNWASEFVAKNLIDEEAVTKKYIVDRFEAKHGYSMEDASVLGSKSDALVQSLPEVVVKQGIALAGNAVVPGLGTLASTALTGLSSMGAEAENAFRNNATYEQAFLSGAVSAAAEMGSEYLFGGIKFGGETLMDGAVKNVVSKVPGKFLKTLTKWGINTAGEGAEEVISGLLSAVGQKMTYLSDKKFNEIFSKEDAWDNFVAGAVLGGIFEGGKVIGSSLPFSKTDYITENLKTEQKVIDSIAKDMIAEQQLSGKKLTESEKSKIYDSIEKKVEKGQIDVATIEKVLGENAIDVVNNTRLAESYKNAMSQKAQYADALSKRGGTEQGATAEANASENVSVKARETVGSNNTYAIKGDGTTNKGVYVNGKLQNTNAIEATTKNIASQKQELYGNNTLQAAENLNKLAEMGNDAIKNVANQGETGKIELAEKVKSSEQLDTRGDDTSSVSGEGGSDALSTPSSKILRQNLIEAGVEVPDYPNAAHHIVAGSSPKAAEARGILQKYGVDINDAANGTFLSTVKDVTGGAYHPSLHTNAYYDKINRLLSEATCKEDVLDILDFIGDELSSGVFMQ